MERTLCGWDVGIKHLAFCVIKKKINGFEITHWENIDLSEGTNKCCAPIKTKKKGEQERICEATATFYYEKNGDIKYYCGSHKMINFKGKISDIEKEYVTQSEKKDKCQFEGKQTKKLCGTCGTNIINGKLYCLTHKKQLIKEHISELSCKAIKKTNCNKFNPQDLCTKLFQTLDKYHDIFKTVDEYYIENQPSLKNPPMKTVASMLFSYFVSHNIKYNINSTIKFVAPSSKIDMDISFYNYIWDDIKKHLASDTYIKKNEKKTCECKYCKLKTEMDKNEQKYKANYSKYRFNYKLTKFLGILYTRKIVDDNNMVSKLELLKSCDKEDDLCDAFLHAYKKL